MLTTTPLDERGVIRLEGEYDMSSQSKLDAILDEMIAAGGRVELDVSDLSFIDSSGMRSILDAAASLGSSGRLVIRRPSRTFRRVLDLMASHGLPNLEIRH